MHVDESHNPLFDFLQILSGISRLNAMSLLSTPLS